VNNCVPIIAFHCSGSFENKSINWTYSSSHGQMSLMLTTSALSIGWQTGSFRLGAAGESEAVEVDAVTEEVESGWTPADAIVSLQDTWALGADAAVRAGEHSGTVAEAVKSGSGGGGGRGGEGGGGRGRRASEGEGRVDGGDGRGEDGSGGSSSSHGQMFSSDEFFRSDTKTGAEDFRTGAAAGAAAADAAPCAAATGTPDDGGAEGAGGRAAIPAEVRLAPPAAAVAEVRAGGGGLSHGQTSSRSLTEASTNLRDNFLRITSPSARIQFQFAEMATLCAEKEDRIDLQMETYFSGRCEEQTVWTHGISPLETN